MTMKSLILISLIVFVAYSINSVQTYQQERNTGVFSDIFSAQPELNNLPSQYFMCGFAFRQQKWTKAINNCDCKQRWYKWRYAYQCVLCDNQFWTMTNAFKAMYCHYEDWNNQKQVIFTTGSNQVRNWRQYKCPKDQYAARVAPRFGWQHNTDTGFVGLTMRCQNAKSTQNTVIQDTNGNNPTSLSKNKQGTFVSGFQIKYQTNGKQTGVKFHFQPMVKISKIEFKFDAILDNIRGVPIVIDTATTSNEESKIAQKSVSFSKQYSIMNTFTNQKSLINDYSFTSNLQVQMPSIKVASGSTPVGIYTNKTSPTFRFGKQLKTTFSSNKPFAIFVPSCTQIEISNIIQQQKMNIPYEATLTFVDVLTQKFVVKGTAKGNWDGKMISSIRTQIKETLLSNCPKKSLTSQN